MPLILGATPGSRLEGNVGIDFFFPASLPCALILQSLLYFLLFFLLVLQLQHISLYVRFPLSDVASNFLSPPPLFLSYTTFRLLVVSSSNPFSSLLSFQVPYMRAWKATYVFKPYVFKVCWKLSYVHLCIYYVWLFWCYGDRDGWLE